MIKINLLPGAAARKELRNYGWYLFVGLLIINLAVLGFLYQRNARSINTWRQAITETKAEVAKMQKIRQEYQIINTERKELERRLSTINTLREGRALSARMIYDLSMITKENVWIKSFKRSEGQFEIDGRSAENDSISDLMENMAKIPYVKSVELKRVEDVAEEGTTVKKFLIQGTVGL